MTRCALPCAATTPFQEPDRDDQACRVLRQQNGGDITPFGACVDRGRLTLSMTRLWRICRGFIRLLLRKSQGAKRQTYYSLPVTKPTRKMAEKPSEFSLLIKKVTLFNLYEINTGEQLLLRCSRSVVCFLLQSV